MFETELTQLKTALEPVFDRVLDLFDEINLPEHRKEALCFLGVGSYKLSDPSAENGGNSETVYLVKALSKKRMTAADFASFFDGIVILAIESCGLNISEIKREPCAYLKEQNCYCLTAEIKVLTKSESGGESGGGKTKPIDFEMCGEPIEGVTGFSITRAVKTAETATFGSGIFNRYVGQKPTKITISGEAEPTAAAEVYSTVESNIEFSDNDIVIAGLEFVGLAITKLNLEGGGKLTKFEIEFTEVNSI